MNRSLSLRGKMEAMKMTMTIKSKYYRITAKANKEAEILIYEQIGKDYWDDSGLGAKEFAEELKALGELDKIILRINSPGGSVFEGLAIYNTLRSHTAEKEVHIDGIAASIASVIAMSGKVIMPENAMLMIHDPAGLVMGPAEDMRKMAETLDKIKDSLIMAYKEKSGMAEKDIADLMSEETWMNGEDALAWGFCDECTKPQKMAASAGLSFFRNFKHIPSEFFKNITVTDSGADINLPDKQTKIGAVQEPAPKQQKEVTNMALCKNCTGLLDDSGECPGCKQEAAVKNAAKTARDGEILRAKNLRVIGKEFSDNQAANSMNLAEIAIEKGWTEDQLRIEILNRIKNAPAQAGYFDGTVTPMHGVKPFRNLGDQLTAIVGAARGQVDNRLLEIQNAASGASEGVPADGGFLVQSDFTLSLLQRANETAILAPRCQTIPVAGNGLDAPVVDETSRATGSRWGGVQVYRTNEAGTVTAKKPKIAMLSMKLEKLMGIFYSTDELLADASALGAIASQAFAEEFAFRIDDEIIRGSGAGQMLGILNAPALVSQSKETGQLADTIQAENIINMYSRMPARNKKNAVWLINSECMPQIMQLSLILGTTAIPLFMPPGGISQAPYGTIFGKPVIEIEQASALGDVGDILFVDLGQYAIIEKGGLVAAQSIHVLFLTDENTFRWTARNNGQPIWKKYMTPYKGSATQSPFVALAERA